MGKSGRLLAKTILAIVGILIIGYILAVSIRMNMIKQPEGEYIRLQDALILTEALDGEYREDSRYIDLEGLLQSDGEALLTYGQLLTLTDIITGKAGNGVYRDKAGNSADNIQEALRMEYKAAYKESYHVLKEDWYELYERLLAYYEMTDTVVPVDIVILGIGSEVTEEAGNELAEDRLLAESGKYLFRSDSFAGYKYQRIRAYQKEGILLTALHTLDRRYSLPNVWITEAGEGMLQAFVKDCELRIPYEKADAAAREQIADMDFADGRLQSVRVKHEKIGGKLLSIKNGQIELEGHGKYDYEEGMKVYKLYGPLSEGGQSELRIGYDFADFVLDKGVICAGLVTRDEAMENIRVVIKNTDFAGAYHEKVELTADTDYIIRYGRQDAPETEEVEAGDTVTIDKDSDFFTGDRIYIEPAALTGRIRILSLKRSQGNPAYRGSIEIEKTQEGLVIVNEVLLEEYLYSVVPSEMPASYPLEALKAQAICARTYAYRHMTRSGIAGFGAHVDDSAGYQVYNNIAENAQTTKAVKETAGRLLYYGDALCGSYYYSTSCGFGTDVNIWKTTSTEDTSYLKAKRIGRDEGGYTGENMTEEGTFADYISRSFASDYEAEEAWYRWTYEVEAVDADAVLTALQKRYAANEKLILTRQRDGSYASEPVAKLGKIKDIRIEKRNAGGAADELVIEGTKNSFKVISEHNIRYILNDGESKVIRQDGSEVASATLLPSAYITIATSKEDKVVIGYKLAGGGYGHGVGMSQNGAKAMAKNGFDAGSILTFFYQDCEVRDAYEL